MKCQGRSERQEGMLDLTVEIQGDIGSLEEALRKFTSTEILDGENKYHCGRLVGLFYSIPILFVYSSFFVTICGRLRKFRPPFYTSPKKVQLGFLFFYSL